MKRTTNSGRYRWKEVRLENFSLIRGALGILKAGVNVLLAKMGASLYKTHRRTGRESVLPQLTPLRSSSFASAALVFVHLVIVLS